MGWGMRKAVEDCIKRHWLACGAASLFLIWIPEFLSSMWGLWSTDLFLPVILQKGGGMSMPPFSIYWVTIPLSLLIVFFITYLKLADKRHIDRDSGSNEFISLRDAAIKVYVESRSQGGWRALHGENMSDLASDYTIRKGDEAHILDGMAWDIADRITIFGVSPSAMRERLGTGKEFQSRFKSYYFDEGAVTLRPMFYGEKGYYEELSVRTEELNELLKDLFENDA